MKESSQGHLKGTRQGRPVGGLLTVRKGSQEEREYMREGGVKGEV